MHNWNTIITVQEGGYRHVLKMLQQFGPVSETDFFNILVMSVFDAHRFAESLRELMARDPEARSFLARVMPLTETFVFHSPEEFEDKAREAVTPWIPALAHKGFHVRMHRRGFKGRLSSQDEERFLDRYLLDALDRAHTPGRLDFDDPDAIIAVETLGTRAGLALWTREDLRRYPFLHLD